MVEPGLVDGANGFLVGLFAQVESADFGPDMFAERNDVEPGSGHDRHGGSPAIIGRLEPNSSFRRDWRRGGVRRLAVLDLPTGQGGENLRNQLPRARSLAATGPLARQLLPFWLGKRRRAA